MPHLKEIEQQIVTLFDALQQGSSGFELITQALQHELKSIRTAASFLLNQEARQSFLEILPQLRVFEFEVVSVDGKGKETSRINSHNLYFAEDLGDGTFLEMVAIPGGTFLMGSPKCEIPWHDEDEENPYVERPQHRVAIAPFFMGKYPVTQAQYQTLMNTNPSYFKGANRPVEHMSWYDAVEFCNRLSEKTLRVYQLPSEAEWEYACRAGTTTPFHFGETITPDVAQYNSTYTYKQSIQPVYRPTQTTLVGNFPANVFGLHDMHGLVQEWCADPWHDNYVNAPTDGKPWDVASNVFYRLRRGGGCGSYPDDCRSAFRFRDSPNNRKYYTGFRVAYFGSF